MIVTKMIHRLSGVLTAITILVLAAGCTNPETKLTHVFRYKFYLVNPPTGTLSYEDKDLDFTFAPERDYIKITLVNNSGGNATIYWNKAVYKDVDGISHRLVTRDMSYKDKDGPQTPVAIPPGHRLVQRALPADNIDHTLFGWKTRPMFPELKTARVIEDWDRAEFKLILPIEVDGELRRYEFVFKIKTR